MTNVPFSLTPTKTDKWYVTCEDGQVRHSDWFATLREADRFAQYGHCCTALHRFHRFDTTVASLLDETDKA